MWQPTGDVRPDIALLPFPLPCCQRERQCLLEETVLPRQLVLTRVVSCPGLGLLWLIGLVGPDQQQQPNLNLSEGKSGRVGCFQPADSRCVGRVTCTFCKPINVVCSLLTCHSFMQRLSHRWVMTASLIGLFSVPYPYHCQPCELFFIWGSLYCAQGGFASWNHKDFLCLSVILKEVWL